ncbi:hypothetical protein EXIGLDRAFT_832504 [Exidia glandulosa HHB12029]|uniref:F-box domain-containing protein n=1 Tax=Exidia glandulosa HHB12029 TaxID=1314781 RepID=A0A166B5L5_EXIGL|nr:hypothetical protein EXIGLDRAFT_832504 [Exidia glandulosa HHB12029]
MPHSLSDLPDLALDPVLQELYTAEDGLTALKSLSATNRHIRAAALPRIFSSIGVVGTLGACAGSMRDILTSGTLATYVRSFTLRVDVSEAVIHDYHTYYNDQTNTLARLVASSDAVECAKALVDLLIATAMQGLRSLTVEPHPIFDTTFVAAIFNHHLATSSVGLDLSHITSLSTSTCCTVVAAACPSVTRLELTVCHDDDTGITEEEAVIWGALTEVLYLTVGIMSACAA